MIRVTVLPDLRLAQAFVDYMATCNVVLEIHNRDQGAEIWLHDEQKLPQARHELQQFFRDPLHSRYQAASWLTGNVHARFPYSSESYSGESYSGESYSGGSYFRIMRSQAGPLTEVVAGLCVITWITMQLAGDGAVMSWLGWPRSSDQYFQLWRWLSHSFLHFSLLHLLVNLMWWWYLGGRLEKRSGSGRLCLLTLAAALVSGGCQALFSGSDFGGLSGVVCALTGYVWLMGEREPACGLSLPRGLMTLSVLWLVAGFLGILTVPVANFAHAAGLAIGLLMALWDTRNSGRIKR